MIKYKFIISILLILVISIIPTKILAADTLDNVIAGANTFFDKGKDSVIDVGELKSSNSLIYNILLGIALIMAVIIGMSLGIKYMVADSENKAKIKETLVPYMASVIIMFAAFALWKVVIGVLSSI